MQLILGVVLAIVSAAVITALLLRRAISDPRCGWFGRTVTQGLTSSPRVALTFDDGPLPPYTGQILDILKEHGVRATFFVCGNSVLLHPELLRRIESDGHELGNHTQHHRYLCFKTVSFIAQEVERAQATIIAAGVRPPRLFRPPYGARWFGLARVLERNRLQQVHWSFSPGEWRKDVKGIEDSVLANLYPGAIILLHDGLQEPGEWLSRKVGRREKQSGNPLGGAHQERVVAALSRIIREGRAAGTMFTTVSELFQPEPHGGK